MRKMIFLSIVALMLIVSSSVGFAETIAIQTSAGTQSYNGNNPVIIDNNLTVNGDSIEDATVTINNVTSGDVLGYTGSLPSGVSASYNSSSGILSFTGTADATDWQMLLRTVTFSGSTVGKREIIFSIGNAVTLDEKEHFYEYISGRLTWFQANDASSIRTKYGLRGYLATINSSDENEYIVSILGDNAWLGASDDYTIINSVVDVPYINQNTA